MLKVNKEILGDVHCYLIRSIVHQQISSSSLYRGSRDGVVRDSSARLFVAGCRWDAVLSALR